MIIKSMSRKNPSFSQLIEYFHEPQYSRKAATFAHNLYESATPEQAAEEFDHNATFLPKRANGNYLYHEIIALEDCSTVSQLKQERILLDLVQRYIAIRAPKQLVYGRMHLDKHLHFHLCISVNAARGKQRLWLSKSRFAHIQSELERYKLEKYPELGTRKYYKRPEEPRQKQAGRSDNNKPAVSRDEFEFEKRTGRASRKQEIRSLLLPIFAHATNLETLKRQLALHQFGFYARGKTEGVIDNSSGKRYRLKTLGLSFAAFVVRERENMQREPTLEAERQAAKPDNPVRQ